MNKQDLDTVREFLNDLLEDGFYVLTVRGMIIMLETKDDVEFAFKRMSSKDDANWQHRLKEAKEGIKRFKEKRRILAM